MALQQHLGHTGHAAQATINLEGRVESPEVVHGAFPDEGLVCLECLITLAEAGAAVHAVCECPSSGSVAAQVECLARCLHPLRLVGLDQSTREQGAEMGNVAVSFLTDVTVVIFLAVFFDLATGTDEDRIELGDLLTDGIEERVFFAQLSARRSVSE